MKAEIRPNIAEKVLEAGSFVLLLLAVFIGTFTMAIVNFRLIPGPLRKKIVPRFSDFFDNFYEQLDYKRNRAISKMDLIDIAIRNMKAKRTRTMVTVGGMTIGIAAIVFLVSIGYGVQEMVVARVARLEEMKQADVSPQVGGKLKINDKTISNFKDIPQIEKSLPLISVVGKVSYKSSVSDMAVYGVTSEYLEQSAIKPVEGKVFESNDLVIDSMTEADTGKVAGTKSVVGKIGQIIREVFFSINPEVWLEVHASPDPQSEIIGYTKRVEGTIQGNEIWGESYKSKDKSGKAGLDVTGYAIGKWIEADYLLWKKIGTSNYQPLKENDYFQKSSKGYITEISIRIDQSLSGNVNVLGASETLPKVEIPSETGNKGDSVVTKVDIGEGAIQEAVINRAALKLMGLDEKDAVGKEFSISFVVVGDLLENSSEKIESNEAKYTIVGVVPDDKTPVLYVPFIDIRSLGVTNYSQLKIVVKEKSDLPRVRHQIEAMGYVTRSVADTVAQINSIFSTAKFILALFGFIALIVASLGMFNTLTVSLLERTREVGLMKAMGMKASEVKELFLTESIIMGALGGIFGIALGLLSGSLLGIGLSIFAIFKGGDTLDVSYLPFIYVLFVISLSLAVGIMTGLYPAKRATKISVLDALRYE